MKKHLIICGTNPAARYGLVDFIRSTHSSEDTVVAQASEIPLSETLEAALARNPSAKLVIILGLYDRHSLDELLFSIASDAVIINPQSEPNYAILTSQFQVIIVTSTPFDKLFLLPLTVQRRFDIVEISNSTRFSTPIELKNQTL